jgi:hypothetical protein
MGLFDKVERHADLVGQMASTLDVDLAQAVQAGQVGEGALRSVVYNCMGCDAPAACKDWLNGHPDGAATAPDYCRNKSLLERIRTPKD